MPPSRAPRNSEVLTLLNPTNERLCGTQFAYFPVGGPTPSAPLIGEPPPLLGRDNNSIIGLRRHRPPPSREPTNKQLGSVRAAERSLYQFESVDGVVTELGGAELELLCRNLSSWPHPDVPDAQEALQYPLRCKCGDARYTPAAGNLSQVFVGGIVHAVPPFWPSTEEDDSYICRSSPDKNCDDPLDGPWGQLLESAYERAFQLAFDQRLKNPSHHDIEEVDALVCPIMGAGARGAPFDCAARVAVKSASNWMNAAASNNGNNSSTCSISLRFGVQDDEHADLLVDILDDIHIAAKH